MLTDNPVIVRNVISQPALMCAQRKAKKIVPTEDDFIQANIDSFGNEIGAITNRTTSMYEIRSHYSEDSEEYKILTYRVQCGQLYQQNQIDRSKGIICKSMPAEWYDRHAINKLGDEDKKKLYRSVVADKKPYFMRYIYPALMKQYNTHIKNTNKKALREFGMTVDDLLDIPKEKRSKEQSEFLKQYNRKMPVGIGDCVMNKICRRFEEEFDGYIGRYGGEADFDYCFMRGEAEYSQAQYDAINRLYKDYNQRLRGFMVSSNYERIDSEDSLSGLAVINDEFAERCAAVCPNEDSLCNIILDICYTKSSTKRFAWSMCGSSIIHNLLSANDNTILYPIADVNGDVEYCHSRFTVRSRKVGDD